MDQYLLLRQGAHSCSCCWRVVLLAARSATYELLDKNLQGLGSALVLAQLARAAAGGQVRDLRGQRGAAEGQLARAHGRRDAERGRAHHRRRARVLQALRQAAARVSGARASTKRACLLDSIPVGRVETQCCPIGWMTDTYAERPLAHSHIPLLQHHGQL